jgi:hypothetical protein
MTPEEEKKAEKEYLSRQMILLAMKSAELDGKLSAMWDDCVRPYYEKVLNPK